MKNQRDRNHSNCLATVNVDDGLHWGTGKSAKTAWTKSVFDSDFSYQQLTLGQRFPGMFGPENGLCRGHACPNPKWPQNEENPPFGLLWPRCLPNFQEVFAVSIGFTDPTILTYIIHMVRYVQNTYILGDEHHFVWRLSSPTNWMGSWTL